MLSHFAVTLHTDVCSCLAEEQRFAHTNFVRFDEGQPCSEAMFSSRYTRRKKDHTSQEVLSAPGAWLSQVEDRDHPTCAKNWRVRVFLDDTKDDDTLLILSQLIDS